MNEKHFGRKIAILRKESGFTQDELAERLHVSPQAVSKWENGHSLPETALLPQLAKLLDTSIDDLFSRNSLVIMEAIYGDGIGGINVTKRLNRFVENDILNITVDAALLGAETNIERASYLTIKYETKNGCCYAAVAEGKTVRLTAEDAPHGLPDNEPSIIAGCYGTRKHWYDVMQRINHFRPFGWNEYRANHETFPSDPANDDTEYLTLVYLNNDGIHMATCAEGEILAYDGNRTKLVRQYTKNEYFIIDVPVLPPFGNGMECSWAAALTAALQSMGIKTDYTEVMGVSGACWRLAFCSPVWDYSSVDGLVAYDYATPGYSAFGYTPVIYGHIEKADRPEHRARIMKELRNSMPVLGINLRVAHEWGVICGYAKDGEDLFCRTKYDAEILRSPDYASGEHNPYDYLYVDNWPFLLSYFNNKRKPPSARENLIESLRVFTDCAALEGEKGYFMGFKAYGIWAQDLRDTAFYETCDDEQFARRFSVDQFCILALYDARKSAHEYLARSLSFIDSDEMRMLVNNFSSVTEKTREIHQMLDSGIPLDGLRARKFWTAEKRERQAVLLDEIATIENNALESARIILAL